MNETLHLEQLIKQRWDQANAEGKILYRVDTLTTRSIEHEGITLQLVHNGCRDLYDHSTKSIDKPVSNATPFYDVSSVELARTADGCFKVLGNTFACIQYQCILAPSEPQHSLTTDFLKSSLRFASEHPSLTLMYNAINAGKTVPQQYWLLSFHRYDIFHNVDKNSYDLGMIQGIPVTKHDIPCYMLTLPFSDNIHSMAILLFRLSNYVEFKNFNLFLYDNKAFFIPRENMEIPMGFPNHRFGGLEMIGCFVMKSIEALQIADPITLFNAIQEISYKPLKQSKFEAHFRQNQLESKTAP